MDGVTKAQPDCNCGVETMLCFTEAVPGNGSMLGMSNVRNLLTVQPSPVHKTPVKVLVGVIVDKVF